MNLLSRLRQSRLSSFVDRVSDVAAFHAFLRSEERFLFWVFGEGGIGKSTFLSRLLTDDQVANYSVVELSGSTATHVEPLDVICTICKQLDTMVFPRFDDALARAKRQSIVLNIAPSGNIAVASHASIERSNIGVVAGVQVEALNVNLASSADHGFLQHEINHLTDCFIEDMIHSDSTRPVLICVDAAERLTMKCKDWLLQDLIPRAIDRVHGLRFVICSREQPAFDHAMEQFVTAHQLMPMTTEVILDYLRLKKIREEILEGAAAALFVSTNGNMLLVATHAQQLLTLAQRAQR